MKTKPKAGCERSNRITTLTSVATNMSATQKNGKIIAQQLYRSLIRASKPFTAPSKDAVTLNCLLHRTGFDDDEPLILDRSIREAQLPDGFLDPEDGKGDSDLEGRDVIRSKSDLTNRYIETLMKEYATAATDQSSSTTTTAKKGSATTSNSSSSSTDPIVHPRLFRSLLRETISGSTEGKTKMLFPSQVDSTRLHSIVRREFRDKHPDNVSSQFDDLTRRKVAFTALRELNRKLNLFTTQTAHSTTKTQPAERHPLASHVKPLNRMDPISYLKPGAFLLSHPHMDGSFFGRTVICILDHYEGSIGSERRVGTTTSPSSLSSSSIGHTYGLIINKFSVPVGSDEPFTINDVLPTLPESLAKAFGSATAREGGPVHTAIQMIHRLSPDEELEDWNLGGSLLPDLSDAAAADSVVVDGPNVAGEEVADPILSAVYSDKAVYYQGNIFKAAEAVQAGHLKQDDIAFFVGASTWSPGQLEDEVRSGYWLPCRAPVDLALTALSQDRNEGDESTKETSSGSSSSSRQNDMWSSLMEGCGTEEAKLAKLFVQPSAEERGKENENASPCDIY